MHPRPDASAALARIPLFASLAPAELNDLAGRTVARAYQPEETIFSAGDAGETLFLIASGLVRIVLPSSGSDGEGVVVLMLPGDFFGELALLDGLPRSATAIAMAPTETLTISREDFLAFLVDNPNASLSLLATLSRRLRSTDELIKDAIVLDVPTRLTKKLFELVQSFGEQTPTGAEIAIPITDRELARMIGTQEGVMRDCLNALERDGLVQRHGDRITVPQPERLREHQGWSG